MKNDTKKPFDFWIFLTVLILLSLGIIMVFSASAPAAYNMTGNHDIYHFLKSQLVYAMVGFLLMFAAANIDYRKLGKYTPLLLVISIVLLLLVLIPGIGQLRNGARRWIGVGGFVFQPSEIAKLAVIFFFSYSLSKRKEQLKYFFKGLLPYLLLIGIFAGLIFFEPHLSGIVIIILTAFIILFCAGAKIMHFIMLTVPAGLMLFIAIFTSEYRRARILSFMDPWKYLKDEGWQAVQSLYAIGSGGLFGRGLGKSLQKFLYIPEPYNDFIFSILAEELGFIGILAVMLLFLVLIWRGIKVSINAPDVFGSLTAIGITSLIAVQVLLNIAVVTSSVPATGVSLPFFSAGGSSLVLLMGSVGVLLSISRYSNYSRI